MIVRTLIGGITVTVLGGALTCFAVDVPAPTRYGGVGGAPSGNSTEAAANPQAAGSNAALIRNLHARIQAFIRARQFDEAEAATMQLIQRAPNEQYVQLYMQQIQSGRAAMMAPLQKIIIPKVDLRDASLADVVKFLSDLSGQLSADKKAISFVVQIPAGFTPRPVTLNLRDVPMLDVIRYVTDASQLSFKLEPHAVLIYKRQAAATTGATEATEAAPTPVTTTPAPLVMPPTAPPAPTKTPTTTHKTSHKGSSDSQ